MLRLKSGGRRTARRIDQSAFNAPIMFGICNDPGKADLQQRFDVARTGIALPGWYGAAVIGYLLPATCPATVAMSLSGGQTAAAAARRIWGSLASHCRRRGRRKTRVRRLPPKTDHKQASDQRARASSRPHHIFKLPSGARWTCPRSKLPHYHTQQHATQRRGGPYGFSLAKYLSGSRMN